MFDFKQDSDNLIVAGNGPSIANIHTNLLPENFDVFRCNHFYKESQYYLGNRVKLLACSISIYHSMLDTLRLIDANNDYEIEHIMFDGFVRSGHTKLQKHNFDNKLIHEYDMFYRNTQSKELYQLIKSQITSHKIFPNTGILLIAHGALLGYKNIYVTGIDFYNSNKYIYELEANSALKRFGHSDNPQARNNDIKHGHTQEANYKLLQIMKQYFKDTKIYSLDNIQLIGENADINQIANESFLHSIMFNKPKHEKYIKDLVCNTKDFYNTKNPFRLLERKIRHYIKDKKYQ